MLNNFIFVNNATVDTSNAATRGSGSGESGGSLRIFSEFSENDCEFVDCQLDKLAKLNQNILLNGHLNLDMFRQLQQDDEFCQRVISNIDKSKVFVYKTIC
mgnify:FL=1